MLRREQLGVDAAGPHSEILEAALAQLRHQRRRRHHGHRGGGVESAQRRVAPRFRDRNARRDVFGKPGGVAGGERHAMPDAIGADHETDRSFGGDVDGVRLMALDAARDFTCARQRQSQRGIGRQRHRPEAFGRKKVDADAKASRTLGQRRQGTDHPVHLRVPGVGGDQHPHQPAITVLSNLMRQQCPIHISC